MTGLRGGFGKKLKVLRVTKQLTQAELAGRICRSESLVSSMERGVNAPSFETLAAIARALGVPVKELFDFDSDV